MSTLEQNIEFISSINKELANQLTNYDSEFNKKSSPNPKQQPYTLTDQLNRLQYLSSGSLTVAGCAFTLQEKSETHQKFKESFFQGDIDPESFEHCYQDIHEDLHFAGFTHLVKKRLANKPHLKFTKLPSRRRKPTFMVVSGLAGREKLLELIEEVQPKNVLLIETDIEYLYEFLVSNDLESIKDKSKSELSCSLSISIGCGEPSHVKSEIVHWINLHNELGVEGLLISEAKYPSIKRSAILDFLKNDSWHVDAISRFGYQVDEYNMLRNTAVNFDTLKSRIFQPLQSSNKFLASQPVVITGSGPSLDNSIPTLKEYRDKFLLVSGGSSISTLMENDIKPDIHVQLERSEHQYKLHKELSEKHDLSGIMLISSSTTPAGIQSLFDNVIYFFRPALSPLALYANTQSEILNGEGPDTINAAVASIARLGFKNIGLVGVDCGSASKSSIRSKGAFGGYIPRKLNRVERGALNRTVFTNSRLQTVRDVVNWSLGAYKANPVNFSNGLKITSATNSNIEDFNSWLESCRNYSQSSADKHQHVEIVEAIWDFSVPINKYRLYTSWDVANPRQKTFEFCRKLENIVNTSEDIRDIVLGFRDCVSLSKAQSSQTHQLLPRITRGTIGKICPYILSLYNSLAGESIEKELLDYIKLILLEFIDMLESDLYSVFDAIEPVK